MQGTRCFAGVVTGSTKTCAVIAALHPGRQTSDPLEILGIGVTKSKGLKRGSIINLEAVTRSVRDVVGDAEVMAKREIEAVYVAVPTPSLRTQRSTGVAPVSGPEVAAHHVKRAQEVGRAVPVPPGRELLHVMCQDYALDGRRGVQDPLGMSATRLEADMFIVTGDSTTCQDLSKVVDRAGYRLEELVMTPLATSMSVLEEAERRSGVALLRIGGATTDVLVYLDGKIAHIATLPWGGGSVTRDIARGLGVPEEEAARLKVDHGSACDSYVEEKEEIEVSGPGNWGSRRVDRQLLAHIIEMRFDEIFELVKQEMASAGVLDGISAGVVLTGGGAEVPHLDVLARKVFGRQTRIGVPGLGLAGALDQLAAPAYSTVAGVVLYGASRAQSGALKSATRTFSKVGGWLREFF